MCGLVLKRTLPLVFVGEEISEHGEQPGGKKEHKGFLHRSKPSPKETAADTKEARKLRALQEKKERGAQALQEAMKQKTERDDIVQRRR